MRQFVGKVLLLGLCCGLLGLLEQARAQSASTGTLVGTINDQNGGAVSNAQVELQSLATNFLLKAQTNEVGQYNFPNLPPGDYRLTVAAPGFCKTTLELRVMGCSGRQDSPMMTALAFGYSETAETLARRGARVDNVIAAVALGRADTVGSFVFDSGTLRPDVPLVAPDWFHISNDPRAHIEDLAPTW